MLIVWQGFRLISEGRDFLNVFIIWNKCQLWVKYFWFCYRKAKIILNNELIETYQTKIILLNIRTCSVICSICGFLYMDQAALWIYLLPFTIKICTWYLQGKYLVLNRYTSVHGYLAFACATSQVSVPGTFLARHGLFPVLMYLVLTGYLVLTWCLSSTYGVPIQYLQGIYGDHALLWIYLCSI